MGEVSLKPSLCNVTVIPRSNRHLNRGYEKNRRYIWPDIFGWFGNIECE